MADESAGGTVNIISVGVDTAEALTKIKQLERAISSSAGRIASLEKQGLGNSAEANKRRATLQQQRQDLLVLEAGFKSLANTQKAAAEANEAFAKSSVRVAEATDKLTSSLKAAAAASASAHEAMRAKLLNERAEAAKKAAEWEGKLSESVARAAAASVSANEAMRAKLLNERAEAAKKAAEWEGKLSESVARAAAASVSANEAMRARLLNERAEAAKKAAEWEGKLSESVARAAAASVSAHEAMRAKLLNERAEAARKAAEWEGKLSESVARAAAASVSAHEAMRAKLLNERAEAAKKAAEWEGKLSESVARAAAASVSANEAMRAKLLNERAEAARKAAEWEGKLSESVARAAAASVSAHEAMRAKLLNERAEAAKKAAEWEGKLSESVARAAAASVSAHEAMRAKLLNERAEAAKKAAEWEGKLSESVARAAAASVSAHEAMRAKLLNERAEAAKKAAAAEDLLYRGSALGVPVLERLSDRARQGAKGAEALSRGLSNTGNAAKTMAGHTHAAALAHDALHSAARGVSGVLGGLWLTYARMLPVLLGVAAATKLVKDSISGGLDVGFATQFAAILQTENMLGKGQSDAYTNLATLRDDIRKSLISISRESVFTVEQNAQALQKLSLAGVNAQKGLELLTTASSVAVLAQVDLGKATTMVLDTLYNFGMASESSITMAENYAKASDIMAFTANTVNASFEDIARSFENITSVAGTFNVTIEEASALLQSLAKTGVRGPKAGTYVRNFMDDLLGAPISQRAEKQLDNLNIERYNADLYGEGDFGAAKYIDDLVKSLSELGFVEQQNAIRAITNQRSRRVLRQELIEYKNGLKEVNGELKQTNSLYDRTVKLQADAQGSLARMAEGLTGDTKYQFIMAQSAYNAAVNEAYLYAESDLRGAAQSLQALFRSDEFREMVAGLVTGFASLAKGAAEFTVKALELTKYLDGLGGVLATVAKYATALGGAFLAIKGYAAVSATIAGLGGAAAAAAAGVKLLNTALLANPAVAVGTALVATLVYLDQWYEKSKKYEQSLAGRQAKLDELRKAEAEYAAQVERKQSGNRDWLDSLFPEEKLAETRAEIKATVDSIAADMNSAMDSVSFQNSFDKILNETDTFLTSMRNAARQAGGDFETEYRNKLVRSIEDASETLRAYADTVANLDQSTEAGRQFAAFMTAWLSGISERAMVAGEELGRLNLVLSNQSLKAAAEGLEFGVKDLSQLESANEELMKSIRALELGEDGLFRYQQEQKKTQLASLENAYAALEFAYSMAAAADAPLAVLKQMQAQMVATAINMGRLTDNIALSEREHALQPAKRGPRHDRDPIRAQLEEARTAIQDFKNSYSEMLGSIQDSTKDLAIGPLEAYERSMRAAAEAYDQMFAAISKAKNTSGLSANDRQKLQTDENKLLGEKNKEIRRLVEEYREILEGRSKSLEELEIATGRKVLGAAESWLREYANKYGETVTLLQSDIANLETKLKVAVETGQSDEEVARLTAALKVLKDQRASFGKSATLGAWAADIEESIGIAEKTLESFSQSLDRMADKSSKEGLFGLLSGNAAAFEAAKAQYVRGLQESINEIKRKIREAEQQGDLELKAELKIRLDNLEGDLQDASERIDPILEGWGDSLGDYIANGIVYGFDEGESPAKAFANFLKREIYVALAQALSQQFKLNLVSMFGGGSGSGSSLQGLSDNLSSGFGSAGTIGNIISAGGNFLGSAGISAFGAGMGLTGAQAAAASAAYANAGNFVVNGVSYSGTSLAGSINAGSTVGAAIGPGMAAYGLGQKYGVVGGLAGGVGSAALAGGIGGLASGAGFMSGAGNALAGLGPVGWAAIGVGAILGGVMGNKKPSDKTSWATVNPTSGAVSNIGSMTGKKDPGQEARDNTKTLAQFVGTFANLAGINSSITAMTGGRDGTRLKINRSEGTLGFRTPGAGVANGGNALNYGYGEDAIKAMLNDLIDEGTLPQSTITAWKALREDSAGAARDSGELVSTLNLLVAGYTQLEIQRADVIQAEGETLDASLARMKAIEKSLDSSALPGADLALAIGTITQRFIDLGISVPKTNNEFLNLINGADIATSSGRELFTTLMALAPAFAEVQNAQTSLYDQLLTEEQRSAAVSDAFAELNVRMPESVGALKALIDAQDVTTVAGAELKANLLGLAPAFVELSNAAEEARNEAIDKAKGDLERAYRNERQELDRTKDSLERFIESIAKFKGELKLGNLSPLNPVEKYATAKSQFDSTLSSALSGDQTAMGLLDEYASTFLEASRNLYASGDAYNVDFERVMQALGLAETGAGDQLSEAERSISLLESQVSGLIEINDSVLSVRDAILALVSAQGGTTAGIPGFASGGLHAGGARIVGERGPELEVTGAARYWSFEHTRQMLVGGGDKDSTAAEIRALREEVAALRRQQAEEHRVAVEANYDASSRTATKIADTYEQSARRDRIATRFA